MPAPSLIEGYGLGRAQISYWNHYQILRSYAGKVYEYHSGKKDHVVYCSGG